jgi:large subunit ribosomal protein L18
MDKNKKLNQQRARRRFRVRNRVRGTAAQPRLSVQRTLKHFGCQLVDDVTGRTLASASTRDKDVRDAVAYGGNCDAAAAIGKRIAEKASQAGVETVRLDRGHAKYHGRVKAFADAAREAGLKF